MKAGVLAAALLALALGGGAQAAEARAKPEDVARLMQLMQVDRMFAGMREQIGESMTQSALAAGGGRLSAPQQAILQTYMDRMAQLMFSEQSVAQVTGIVSKVYTDQLSAREVKDIIAFYESASGRSMMRKMPQITQQSMQLSLEWVRSMEPQMQVLAEEMQAELQQSLSEPAAAPAPALTPIPAP
ncbi:DUF2059 domain-containing protein [Solimonas sp. SE-A11]|uniref:DUF2059 domain-containing protein n=1 Tax=Solimonas sp. SE-A11 TaxID=3054954 RepID=UPI00259CCD8A|nr:DUF2059 domain-containing protein [Solimonas sp. SE-A11]MDM4771070.1 DUF2059 domain-containing protein [Solimonas sp. SE-A11]